MGRRESLEARTAPSLILDIEAELVCSDCRRRFQTLVYLAIGRGPDNHGGEPIAAELEEVRCGSCRGARA